MSAHKGSSKRSGSALRLLRKIAGARPAQAAALLGAGTLTGLALWEIPETREQLGLGIAIAAPLATGHLWLLRFTPRPYARRWHRWMATLPFGAAAWGILSFFDAPGVVLQDASLGGHVGSAIIGGRDATGILRLAGLSLLAVGLAAPGTTWSAVKASAIAAGRLSIYAATGIAKVAWRAAAAMGRWTKDVTPKAASALWRMGQAPAKKLAANPPKPLSKRRKAAVATGPEAGAAVYTPAQEAGLEGAVVVGGRGRGGLSEADVPLSKSVEPGGWHLPSIDLLDKDAPKVLEKVDNEGRARSIEEAFASYGIDASVVEINPGPAVTQFGLAPGWVRKFREVRLRDEAGKFLLDGEGNPQVRKEEVSKMRVKVDAISNLDKDLAMALAVPSIRIEAPIPGKAMVGLEVPNSHSETVNLRSGITSIAFQKLKEKSKLAIVLGKGSGGQPEVADLAKMPHLLVAGTTGSGKSIGLRSILVCLLMHATPRELRLLLVDPKRVELVAFNNVPHLVGPVIVDVEKVVDGLRWAIQEMEERYKRFAEVGARNLEAYNKDKNVADPLPFLVIMIDELADLMMAAPMDVEHSIIRLAQLGRATGIHLIAATQRPSVNVVTGLIKANFPTRLSFAVSSQVDSRTILDSVGAEKLLGKGDMLYLPQDAPKPKRIQGAYVSDAEVERLVRAWGQQRKDQPKPLVSVPVDDSTPPGAGEGLGSGATNPIARGSAGGDAMPATSNRAAVLAGMATDPGRGNAGSFDPSAGAGAALSIARPAAQVTPSPAPVWAPNNSARSAATRSASGSIAVLPSTPLAAPSASALAAPFPSATGPSKKAGVVDKDPLMPKAREVAKQYNKISASLIQRKLKVGYNKAARLVELLEEEGYGEGDDEDVL